MSRVEQSAARRAVLEPLEPRRLLDGALYTLAVDGGSGDGQYEAGAAVLIAADTPPAGESFNMWIGEVGTRDGLTTLDWD
ncbi:unnamed protein product, partial [marine sediment metagenome]